MSRSPFAQNLGVCRQVVLNMPSLPRCTLRIDEQGKESQGVLQMRNRPWNKLEGTGFLESPRKFYAMTGKACKLKGKASACKGRDWTPPSFSGRHLFTMRFVKFFTDIISFNP